MNREEQILRDCRGIGCTWIGSPPAEVTALWERGYLRRDDQAPHTYVTIEGAVAPDSDDGDEA